MRLFGTFTPLQRMIGFVLQIILIFGAYRGVDFVLDHQWRARIREQFEDCDTHIGSADAQRIVREIVGKSSEWARRAGFEHPSELLAHLEGTPGRRGINFARSTSDGHESMHVWHVYLRTQGRPLNFEWEIELSKCGKLVAVREMSL